MKQILLLLIGFSSFIVADLSRNSDIVTDSATGLQWQDDAVGSTMSWSDAIEYCENTLTLGGYEDWRLPNLNELTSIVDDTQYNPSINTGTNAFQNTISDYYWSSTTYAGGTSNAWTVYFYYGYQNINDKSYGYYVRCVRSGQVETSTFKAPPLSLVNFGSKTLSDIPGGQTSLHLTYDKGYGEFKVNSGDWIRTKTENVDVIDGDIVTLRAVTPAKDTDGVMHLTLNDDNGYTVEYELEANSSKAFYYTSSDTDEDYIPDAWEELGYVPIDSDDDGDVDTFWDFDVSRTDFITMNNKPLKGIKDRNYSPHLKHKFPTHNFYQ